MTKSENIEKTVLTAQIHGTNPRSFLVSIFTPVGNNMPMAKAIGPMSITMTTTLCHHKNEIVINMSCFPIKRKNRPKQQTRKTSIWNIKGLFILFVEKLPKPLAKRKVNKAMLRA